LAAALRTLIAIITSAPPREISFFASGTNRPVVYADAFFELGKRQYRPSDPDIPLNWNPMSQPTSDNGWGVIFFPRLAGWPEAIALEGTVPKHVVDKFCTRRAYIYMLEALAQCIPLWCFSTWMTHAYLSFCDNDAARHAIVKGYGKDEGVNALISTFWCAACQAQTNPWIERVNSKTNISDGISRRDLSLIRKHGWLLIKIDFTETWQILLRAADDVEFAVSQAWPLLKASLEPQILSILASHNVNVHVTTARGEQH
jgi:hypothetical protein